jgi:hypothetical protein
LRLLWPTDRARALVRRLDTESILNVYERPIAGDFQRAVKAMIAAASLSEREEQGG